MTDKIRSLLEDVQTAYEGKGMVVHPNSFDKLRMEVIRLDNTNKQQVEKMKYLEQLLKDIITSEGDNREELLKEAEHYLKDSKED